MKYLLVFRSLLKVLDFPVLSDWAWSSRDLLLITTREAELAGHAIQNLVIHHRLPIINGIVVTDDLLPQKNGSLAVWIAEENLLTLL